MGRLLAIDYGEKRVGLAVSDYMQVIATKLSTVSTLNIFSYLEDYMSREEIDLIVVGNPKQLDNTPSQVAKYVKVFVINIINTFKSIPVYVIDERYTSKIASQTIAKTTLKKKKKQDKALIDTVAAVLILQDFMKMYSQGLPLVRLDNKSSDYINQFFEGNLSEQQEENAEGIE